MFYFDAHCDTLSTGRDLWNNKGHFDLTRATARGPGVQVMAAFGEGKEGQLARMRLAQGTLPENFWLIGAVEGGEDISELTDVVMYGKMGMQILGLTWNGDNRLAGGCGGSGTGLTSLGREVVTACGEMDILVDLAHAGEKTFWETIELVQKPPVVTHACCGSLRPHRRNLSDEQIKALANTGGVMGIAFFPEFLTENTKADINDIAAHIIHAVNTGGSEAVGLGSDFDGFDESPTGMEGVQDIPNLLDLLPFSYDVKEKIMGRNFLRLML